MNFEAQFPTIQDRLFDDSYCDHEGVRMSAVLMKDWNEYMEAYFESACALIAIAQDKSQRPRIYVDAIVMPAIFLFRQYLELALKKLVSLQQRRCGDKNGDYPKTHNLKEMWEEAKKDIDELPGLQISDFAGLESCIHEFHEMDEKSFNFRFPIDKKGEPTLGDLNRINMINFREVMHRVKTSLEVIDNALDNACKNLKE